MKTFTITNKQSKDKNSIIKALETKYDIKFIMIRKSDIVVFVK